MPRESGAPVVMSVVGDTFTEGCRILVIIWDSASSVGDTVKLIDRVTNEVLWVGRTDSIATNQGANFGMEGLHCPNGFKLNQISSGSLYIYIRRA